MKVYSLQIAAVSIATLLASLIVSPTHAGLIGYWNFDASNATDLSGLGNTGTVGSNVVFTTDTPFGTGRAGGTGTGGGATRVVTIADSTSLRTIGNEFAISFWIKGSTANNANWVRMFQKGTEGNGDRSWLINRYDNTDDVNIRVDTVGTGGVHNQNRANGGTAVLDGQWHHVLYTINNGQYVEYVDGQVSMSGTYSHGDGFYNVRPLYIFGRNDVGEYVGLLDDIGLWNTSLDAGRAKSIHNVSQTLGLNYDLGDMLSLWSIFDQGPGGFGMVEGMPWWYTSELPGTPAALGETYVYDDLMYVVLGSGVGLRTPEPSSLLLGLLALVLLAMRRRR
ncbi:MAG: LamG domain-containing protein [Patescibacteria group bacterium]|nr:LamG domain-containing protein [Patescibacteria group bacterium]